MNVVCVLSGGMDSAVLLYRLIADGHDVSAISIQYGQRHARELVAAQSIAERAGVDWQLVDLTGLRAVMLGSSQTDEGVEVPHGHYEEPTMKKTVVPNRNMILIAVAAAHAISHGCDTVAYGAHAGDHAIYPDCRPEFVAAMAAPLALCDYTPIRLIAPFLDLNKGDIAKEGRNLGVPFELTWTCYEGGDVHCGKCGACQERLEAFSHCGINDPVHYRALA